MQLRIGLAQAPRELVIEVEDSLNAKKLTAQIAKAAAATSPLLTLTDLKGQEVVIDASRVAYIDFGPSSDSQGIGFGS